MLVGLPASGKSSYAKRLAEETGAKVFSSDELRETTGERDNAKVFSTLREGIRRELLEGNDCVLDATNVGRKKRTAFLNELRVEGVERTCVLFVVPVEECKRRNALRENRHGVTDEVIDRMFLGFEVPWFSDGFDRIEVIAYDGGYEPVPSEETLDAFKQDNRHHELTVGEHERLAAAYVEKRFVFTEWYPHVLEAARRHDDGKFYAKTFRSSRSEPTTEAHFYGHENASAYLFLLRAFCSGRYEREGEYPFTQWGRLFVALLVNLHMRPLNAWKLSRASRERDELRFGKETIECLEALNEADLFAHAQSDLSQVEPLVKMTRRVAGGTA